MSVCVLVIVDQCDVDLYDCRKFMTCYSSRGSAAFRSACLRRCLFFLSYDRCSRWWRPSCRSLFLPVAAKLVAVFLTMTPLLNSLLIVILELQPDVKRSMRLLSWHSGEWTRSSADAEIVRHASCRTESLLPPKCKTPRFFHTQLVYISRIWDHRIPQSGSDSACGYPGHQPIPSCVHFHFLLHSVVTVPSIRDRHASCS